MTDSDAVDYDELIERIMEDCGLNEMCADVSALCNQITENRKVSEAQNKTIMSLINRLESRIDAHMEAQATHPAREVNELKTWLKEYMDGYIKTTNDKIEQHDETIKGLKTEIYGNGSRGLKTEIESIKTKAGITLWLVGILLTGGGVSGAAYLIWQIVFGG